MDLCSCDRKEDLTFERVQFQEQQDKGKEPFDRDKISKSKNLLLEKD